MERSAAGHLEQHSGGPAGALVMPIANQDAAVFTPPFEEGTRAWALCLQAARTLNATLPPSWDDNRLPLVRTRLLTSAKEAGSQVQRVRFIISVLTDLRSQGWSVGVTKGKVRIVRPDLTEKASV